jgi:beta-N-acetylhexosaminidase
VALIRDDDGLVPIPENLSRVMVIGPGEGWDLYPALLSALGERGFTAEYFDFPPPWEGAIKDDQLLGELPRQAAGKDLVLLFTWQAHLNKLDYQDTWQVDLVQRLIESGTPLIVIAIKSPTDILEFPDIGTYIAMYGTTPGQEQMLVDALVGQAVLQGINPLPGLLP